ncbi:hypothetical protein ACP4OV_015002 [Aristida adscensionis]
MALATNNNKFTRIREQLLQRLLPLEPAIRSAASSHGASARGGSTGTAASTFANVLQQLPLPAGSVLVFQALSASFTNYGECHTSNWWLSLALVTFLALSCSLFAITDSLEHDDKLYYGMATPKGFWLFNASREEQEDMEEEFMSLGLDCRDVVRAIFSAVVFLSFAASDKGSQNCFFPRADTDVEQLLKNTPLMMLVISSCVFALLPTKRMGVDFLYVIRANNPQHA